MIEVCEENILKKRKHKKGLRKTFIVFFLILAIFLHNKYFISKNITKICTDYTYSYATNAINKAIFDTFGEQIEYSDLIFVEKNENDDIVLISADWLKVNSLSRKITLLAEKELNEKLEDGIPIPWLAFSGIGIVSGLGRKINVKLVTISSVDCQFNSRFKSVGINQTLHSIYVDVVCKLNVDYPFNNNEIETCSSILLVETILVGKVPEVYLNGGVFNNK